MKHEDWITLDYLEFFCQRNHLIIGCQRGEEEVWISPLGPHPSTLTSAEVHDILRESPLFEIRKILQNEPDLTDSDSITRTELEQRIQRMMN